MILCPFCAYINNISSTKPNVNSYYFEKDPPHGFKHLEKSGAFLTCDYKLYPRIDSDLFYVKELHITDPILKDRFAYYLDKFICDICAYQIYESNGCIVIGEMDEQEKLFKLFMRNNKEI